MELEEVLAMRAIEDLDAMVGSSRRVLERTMRYVEKWPKRIFKTNV